MSCVTCQENLVTVWPFAMLVMELCTTRQSARSPPKLKYQTCHLAVNHVWKVTGGRWQFCLLNKFFQAAICMLNSIGTRFLFENSPVLWSCATQVWSLMASHVNVLKMRPFGPRWSPHVSSPQRRSGPFWAVDRSMHGGQVMLENCRKAEMYWIKSPDQQRQ